MITVVNKVGKLVEVRIQSPITALEITEMGRQILEVTRRCGTIRGVTDLRGATVFPAEIADQIVGFLRQDSPNIERGGFILGDSAVFALQLDRVLRDSRSDKRRFFRERRHLEAWLGEVLTIAEADRLAVFLSDGEAIPPSPPSSPPRSRPTNTPTPPQGATAPSSQRRRG